jgi:hypothetical protein
MSAEGRAFVYVIARAFLFFARRDLQLDEEIASTEDRRLAMTWL